MSKATAVVLAGSRPGVDAFAASHGTDLKALIPVGGSPMVRRPVEALLASDRIGKVRVLAQQVDRIADVLPNDPRVSVEPSGTTIAATLEAICFDDKTEWPLLVTTGDHALLRPAMIEEFLDCAEGADIAIGVVEQRNLLKRLPQSQRTWLKFRGGAYSGANLFVLSNRKVISALELWRTVEQDRKKTWRVIGLLGPFEILRVVLRLGTLEGTLKRISRKIGLRVQAVEMSDPLAAVDVDKPVDHVLVEAILDGRA